MRAIFLSERVERIRWVYSNEMISLLEKDFNLDRTIYSKQYVLENAKDFQDVNFIFSTWCIPSFSEKEIKSFFPNLEAVFYAGGTVQNFARGFLNLGVKVFSAWVANAIPVMEFTVSQILLANKGFFQGLFRIREDYQSAKEFCSNYIGNYNSKIGILGDGAIGTLVIDELLRHHLDVYVYSITMTQEMAKERGVHLCSLKEIFSTCNVISNHLANNEKTVGIINRNLIFSMKDYTTFINTGRGAQIDEDALIECLENNDTITAVLDVTNPEPPLKNSKLYSLPNVIMSPHMAGSYGREVERMAEYMYQEAKRYVKKQKTLYEVTLEMLNIMS